MIFARTQHLKVGHLTKYCSKWQSCAYPKSHVESDFLNKRNLVIWSSLLSKDLLSSAVCVGENHFKYMI